jgi:hypothetical protein
MVRLVWGESDKRLYETGIDRGVIYPLDGGLGVPWSGLIAVSEAPSGSDLFESHYDGDKFRQQRRSESFAAKISAYSYPRELEPYIGFSDNGTTAQHRKPFGFSYRTLMIDEYNNETELIHLVYNAMVTPLSNTYSSQTSSSSAITSMWDLYTVPEIFPTGEVSAHVVINTKMAYPWVTPVLEDMLYGGENTFARLPGVNELVDIFENGSLLKVVDHGDGTWTATGPDEAFNIIGDYFEITWPSAMWIDTNTYRLRSL